METKPQQIGAYRGPEYLVYDLVQSPPLGNTLVEKIARNLPARTMDCIKQLRLGSNEELTVLEELTDCIDKRRLYILDESGPPANTEDSTSTNIVGLA